jgi:tetratricopeptide (TPR) repeat protein
MEPNWKELVEKGWEYAEDEERLIDYFKKVAKEYPIAARAKFELANAYDFVGKEEEAIPLYEQALAIGLSLEYEGYASIQLGSSLRNVGRLEEAIDLLSNAKDRFPHLPSITMFLAIALHDSERCSEATKQVLEEMLKNVKTPDIERYSKGLSHYIKEL